MRLHWAARYVDELSYSLPFATIVEFDGMIALHRAIETNIVPEGLMNYLVKLRGMSVRRDW